MSSLFYDEIEIEDFEFNASEQIYSYPCPCGDRFLIHLDELAQGEEVARCPSCSLMIRVIYDAVQFASSPMKLSEEAISV